MGWLGGFIIGLLVGMIVMALYFRLRAALSTGEDAE